MKVLGLDTATLTAGLALLEDDAVLAEARHEATQRTNDLLHFQIAGRAELRLPDHRPATHPRLRGLPARKAFVTSAASTWVGLNVDPVIPEP